MSTHKPVRQEISRRGLVVRVLLLVAGLIAVGLAVRSLPGLQEVRERLGAADVWGIALVAVLELGSVLGFVVALRGAFSGRPPWRVALALGTAEQAANVLLPAGGVGGLALGAAVAADAGVPKQIAISRTIALFLVTSTVTFVAIGVGGVLAGPGLGRVAWYGSTLPAVLAAIVVAAVAASPRLPAGRRGLGRRMTAEMQAGVVEAVALVRQPEVALIVGATTYFAFDVAALAAAFVALGVPAPALGIFLLAYTLGQAGGMLPLPGGIGGVDGGLIGMFILYGTPLQDATAAVLAYRLFQLTLPVICGLPGMAVMAHRRRTSRDPSSVAAQFASFTERPIDTDQRPRLSQRSEGAVQASIPKPDDCTMTITRT